MAKKNNKPTKEDVEVIVPDENTSKKETKVSKAKNKNVEKTDNKKLADNKKGKNTQKKEKKSIKKKASEVWSELKKVSRPSFGKVVKNTCVVISVVAICTVLLWGVDRLFSLVYDLLVK